MSQQQQQQFPVIAKLLEQFPKRCGNLHFDETVIPRNCYESDGVCTMQCAPGFEYASGNYELQCLPEGEWSGQPLFCARIGGGQVPVKQPLVSKLRAMPLVSKLMGKLEEDQEETGKFQPIAARLKEYRQGQGQEWETPEQDGDVTEPSYLVERYPNLARLVSARRRARGRGF